MPTTTDRIVLSCSEIEVFTSILVLSKDFDKLSKANTYLSQSIGNIQSVIHPGNWHLRGLRTFRQGRSQGSCGWLFFSSGIQGALYTTTHSQGLGEPGPLWSPAPRYRVPLSCSKYRKYMIRFILSTDTPLHIMQGLMSLYK